MSSRYADDASGGQPALRPASGFQPKYDLFVMYASADRDWVRGFLLPALGLPSQAVVTTEDFTPGAAVVGEFERAVVGARFTVIVFSAAFLTDEWSVFGELMASHASVARAADRLVPLLLEACEIPLHVDFRVRLDCTVQARWEPEVARLRSLLERVEPLTEDVLCPYPGMVPFGPANIRFFHGREREIDDMLRRLRHQRFLLVVGPSGSGKSSLVFAGLLPKLVDRDGDRWLVRSLRPGGAPMRSLAAVVNGEPGTVSVQQLGKLVDVLLQQHPPAERLLLVVDQLEEAFSQAPKSEQSGFLAALNALRLLERCVLVLTMRADFYPELMTCELWPLGPGERVEIAPLRGAALREAIARPAAQVGVYLEAVLLERLLHDAAEEPGVLPLVQETMVLLWSRRTRRLLTLGAYESLGSDGRSGLAVALATKADATLAALPSVQQLTARRILLRLVQLGEGRDDTRRQQPIAALRSGEDEPGFFDETLHHLVSHRLLTVTGQEGDEEREARVDLAHEVLIAGWPTLRRWVEEDREGLRIRGQLSDDAREWERVHRDPGALYRGARLVAASEWANRHGRELTALERAFLEAGRAVAVSELEAAQAQAAQQARAARRLSWAAVALSVLVILAIISTVLAVQATNKAQGEARFATSRYLAGRAVADLTDRLDRSLLLSVESLRTRNTVEARSALLAGLQRRPGLLAFLRNYEVAKENSRVRSVAFSPDGTTLASGGDDGSIVLWEMASRQRLGEPLTGHHGHVWSVAFSPDGRTLASGSIDGSVVLWDVASRRRLGTLLHGDYGSFWTLAFSPDGQKLASGGDDGTIVLWDVAGRRRLAELHDPDRNYIRSVAFSPDGTTLASGGIGAIHLWDVAGRRHLGKPLTALKGGVGSVAFSPDGTTLASGDVNGAILLWDVAGRRRLGEPLTGHRGEVWSVAFSPDGTTLASSDADGAILLWDVAGRRRLGEPLSGHRDIVLTVAFSPDGRTLASGDGDGTILLWDVAGRRRLGELQDADRTGVWSMAFSPDGRMLASTSGDRKVRLWDVAARRHLGELEQHKPLDKRRKRSALSRSHRTVAFSPDGTMLVAPGDDGSIVLWDVAARRRLGELRDDDNGAVRSVAFSPTDGTMLASIHAYGAILLWDVVGRRRLGEPLTGHSGLESVAFSPDGATLASSTHEGAILLWDVVGRRRLGEPLTGHSGLESVAFSPDGTMLASSSRDGAILWDVVGRRRLGEPLTMGRDDEVGDVAFSRDGRTLVSGGGDGSLVLWDVALDSWQARACAIANRNLNRREWKELIGAIRPYKATCSRLPIPN